MTLQRDNLEEQLTAVTTHRRNVVCKTAQKATQRQLMRSYCYGGVVIRRMGSAVHMNTNDEQSASTKQTRYSYHVAKPNGQVEVITARSARIKDGCLLFSAGAGWVRIFAPGTWLQVTRK
jgi:hypothetical protein